MERKAFVFGLTGQFKLVGATILLALGQFFWALILVIFAMLDYYFYFQLSKTEQKILLAELNNKLDEYRDLEGIDHFKVKRRLNNGKRKRYK